MKRLLLNFTLSLIILTVAHTSMAQTPTQITNTAGNTLYVYVGSLNRAASNSSNSQKIVVKVLGGSWFADSDGETIFYISNRGGLVINKTSLGSNTTSRLAIKAYQNGDNTDFYIVPRADDYTSFAVSSYSFGYALTPEFVSITTQSAAPTTTDITASITVTPIMITDSSGNIGIGTDVPDTKLAVNGTIHAKEVKVDMNNWNDFVFDKSYPLPKLSAVKTYIELNHHLPEIPSAAEIIKNGVNLGEMVKLQTKKVEELTLYLIEKDNKDKDKDAQLKSQQAQITQQNTKAAIQQKQIDELKQQVEAITKVLHKK